MTPSPSDDRAISQSHLDLERRIRDRAYRIYQARNGRPGSALADWLQAEEEILGTASQPAQDRGTVIGSAKNPGIVYDR